MSMLGDFSGLGKNIFIEKCLKTSKFIVDKLTVIFLSTFLKVVPYLFL